MNDFVFVLIFITAVLLLNIKLALIGVYFIKHAILRSNVTGKEEKK